MSALLMPTARAISSIGASCRPRSSKSARVAATISRSRLRRAARSVAEAGDMARFYVTKRTVDKRLHPALTWWHVNDRRPARGRRGGVLARAHPGPARYPRLGPRLREERRPPRRVGVGRA